MENENAGFAVSDEAIINRIHLVRNKRVMLDRDLAELYGVTTFRLNEQVKRNLKRFPEDFMFKLTKEEKLQIVEDHEEYTSLKFSPSLPNVFTEHGTIMLASVLNSERAIQVNIQIVRIFTKMREMLLAHKDIMINLEKLERKLAEHDTDIQVIFKALRQLLTPEIPPRKRIGFRRKYEEDEGDLSAKVS